MRQNRSSGFGDIESELKVLEKELEDDSELIIFLEQVVVCNYVLPDKHLKCTIEACSATIENADDLSQTFEVRDHKKVSIHHQ